jgi:hypothetical protein
MRRTRFLVIVLVAAMSLLAFSSMNVGAAQKAKANKAQRQIAVRTLASSKIPVTIDDTTATPVGKQTVLTYSISNRTFGRLESIDVSVFIVDASGHIKGGEGWEQSLDLRANATEEFPRILESKVASGDRLVLAVSRATGQEGEFELEAPELIDSVKSPVLGAKRTSPAVRYSKVSFQGTETFCQKAQKQADQACSCGVQSFNCNETQKSFSYTCFPRTNCIQN